MSVDFQNIVPAQFALPQQLTTSKSILRKTLMEILPSSQQTFGPGANDWITFNISSNMDFLSGPESYIRFSLSRPSTDASVNDQDQELITEPLALEVGGVNALFKTIEVRSLASGILLQRYDNYNRYYALKSKIHHKPHDVDVMGASYGDSISTHRITQEPASMARFGVGTVSVNGVGTVTGTNTRFTSDVRPGDIMTVYVIGATPIIGTVRSIASNTSLDMDCINPAVGGPASYSVRKMQVHNSARTEFAACRVSAINGGAKIIEFKPMLSILQHQLPLFLMKGGIEIRFQLEDAYKAFTVGAPHDAYRGDLANYKNYTYNIDTPRFMAMMVTPSPDIVSEYVREWKSGSGLLYSIPSVRTRRVDGNSISETSASYQTSVGVRSARKVYVMVQDSVLHESSDNYAYVNNCLSTCLRDAISEFQFKVGSHNFPNRSVKCSDNIFSEALEQLKIVSRSAGFRFHLKDWAETIAYPVSDTASCVDANSFIISADLSRDNGMNSNLSGVDLSIVPLDLDLQRYADRSAAKTRYNVVHAGTSPGKPIYWFFVEHDSYLKIASDQMSVMN